MKIYIRKMFPHDISHQISITKKIVQDFFGFNPNKDNYFVCKKADENNTYNISILKATDPRFGGDIKNLNIELNDFLVIYKKENTNYYTIDIIKSSDNKYRGVELFFNQNNINDRHFVAEMLFDNDEQETNNISNENKNIPDIAILEKLKIFNRIIFGAPGTGKSHQLNEDAEKIFKTQDLPLAQDGTQQNIDFIERVTFHPNYSYAHFVGTYKPVQDKGDPKQIRYEYVPGPFMRTLTKALNNPGSNFLLIIEEINRANVAAVFGDVFQMLDRDDKGTSEYPIAASEDIKKYLKDEIKTGNIDLEQIRIPSNMYIWATMNSADQGVFPMDAAFKRRWNFEYLGIDAKANDAKGDIPIGSPNGTTDFDMINWNKFRTKLNEKLKSLSNIRVNEDKLLGPFFISQSDIKKSNTDYEKKKQFRDKFKSKVLMYLFEDVVKMNPGNLFVCGKNNPHFSEICQTFDDKGIKELFGFTDEEYGEMKA